MATAPNISTVRDILNPQIPESGEVNLRPLSLRDFVGQHKLKESLSVFIKAAMSRNTPLDHVLFHGPPGLGKTTLAQIIARELGVNIKISSGPMITKPGDLAAILTNLQPHDVLFIDEIHRLPNTVEEVLYPAMEDFYIDVIIGDGPAARTVKIDLPHFTLIGATTRPGLLTNPLRDRFGIPMKLSFYSLEELQGVLARNAVLLSIGIIDEAKSIIARCARGTPRIAIRLLKRVRDFAQVHGEQTISLTTVSQAFRSLQIDELGLDELDRSYIRYIIEHYGGGPVGIDTIAAGLAEDRDTIEDTIEPHLMQIGFIARTPRGRTVTQRCIDYTRANWLPLSAELSKKAE